MARKADGAKRELWSRRLREFERVGGAVAEFCRREGVSVASFYEWRRRLGSTRTGSQREGLPAGGGVAGRGQGAGLRGHGARVRKLGDQNALAAGSRSAAARDQHSLAAGSRKTVAARDHSLVTARGRKSATVEGQGSVGVEASSVEGHGSAAVEASSVGGGGLGVRFLPVEITGSLGESSDACQRSPLMTRPPSEELHRVAGHGLGKRGAAAHDLAEQVGDAQALAEQVTGALAEGVDLEVRLPNGVCVTVPCRAVEAIEVVMRALVKAAREERSC